MKKRWGLGLAALLALDVTFSILSYAGIFSPARYTQQRVDLLAHFFLIGGLAFFTDGLGGHWRVRLGPWLRVPPWTLGWMALMGVDEWLQHFNRFRSSSWMDFSATVAGLLFFTWLAPRVSQRL
jgi:hypothetical protein